MVVVARTQASEPPSHDQKSSLSRPSYSYICPVLAEGKCSPGTCRVLQPGTAFRDCTFHNRMQLSVTCSLLSSSSCIFLCELEHECENSRGRKRLRLPK